MSTTITLARRRNAVALAGGIVNLLIGLAVLAGYAVQNLWLIAPSGSAPMRLTTALAVACCGAAVLFLAGGWFRAAAAGAAIAGLIGLVNLAEAIAGVHLPGYDPAPFPTGTPPSAGMLIACLLVLAAGGLILMSGVVRVRSRLAIVGSIGSLLLSVGVVAAASYGVGVSAAFVSGEYSRLAIHAGLALAALGAALMRFAWRDAAAAGTGAPAWTPLLVGVGALATTFCLYGAMAADIEADFAHQVDFEAEGLRQFIHAGVENRIQPLIALARHRAAVPDLKKDEWDADTQTILTRGGYQAIEWIDAAGRLVWSSPPGAGDATPDGNAVFEARRKAAFEEARRNRAAAATQPVDLVTGGRGLIVIVPVFVREEAAGYVAGVFRYQTLFQSLLASNPSPRYAIAVEDGGEKVFRQGIAAQAPGMVRRMQLAVAGEPWVLEITPTETLVLQARSPVPGALLVGGIFLAMVLTVLIHLVQHSGARPLVESAARAPEAAGPPSDASPVVSYNPDGKPLAWNDYASRLFHGAPPPILACETGFRTLRAGLVRAGSPAGELEGLRMLLESSPLPTLIFDAEGALAAANPAAERTLGWSHETWSGRQAGGLSVPGSAPLEIHYVLLMQGRWTGHSAAAVAGR